MAVSARIRNEVWQEYLDAARLGRYYAALAERHQRRHRILQCILGFAAVGGLARFVGLLSGDWNWVSDLASIVIVALVIFELTTDYAKRAAILAAIYVECGELEILWQSLWHDVDAADAEEEAIRNRLRDLSARMLRATASMGYVDMKEDRRLNERAAEESYRVMEARYAAEGGADGRL